jgi:hypothetical protein
METVTAGRHVRRDMAVQMLVDGKPSQLTAC